MKPPERFRQRVFPLWWPPADGWQSIAHHEAGHVVAAECYGLAPHSAGVDMNNGCGEMLMLPPPAIAAPPRDEGSGALGLLGLVGLADTSNSFEEMALRSAVIYMAGVQAELVQAGITPAGVLRLNDKDTRQASFLLRFNLKTDIALGWAQLQARYLLSTHWERVEEISNELHEKGCWRHQGSAHEY